MANGKQVEGLPTPAGGQADWDGPVSGRTCQLMIVPWNGLWIPIHIHYV